MDFPENIYVTPREPDFLIRSVASIYGNERIFNKSQLIQSVISGSLELQSKSLFLQMRSIQEKIRFYRTLRQQESSPARAQSIDHLICELVSRFSSACIAVRVK